MSRDDQVFQALDAGINAGQHAGGGKAVDARRFGFNLDHGGVSGGLEVLVDRDGDADSDCDDQFPSGPLRRLGKL